MPKPEWDLILSASQKNQADEVFSLLVGGVPATHSNVVGQTGLHIAALWGSVETMEVLINAGADVNAQNQIAKMTPLHCAIRGTFQSFKQTHTRRIECVKLLLQAGADCGIQDMKGKDAFECIDVAIREANTRQQSIGSIEEEMEEMRKVLRLNGANLSQLGQCIDGIDLEGVRHSLGVDGSNAVTPMEVEKGLLAAADKFKFLLDEESTDEGAYKSLSGIMKLLLEAGADPNAHPPITNTPAPLSEAPLHILSSGICTAHAFSPSVGSAASDPVATIIQNLRSHGAKVGSQTMSLLPNAAHRGKVDSVKFLVDQVGIDVNYRGRQGMTSLILASRTGKIDIVKLLLTYESLDLDISDDVGKKAIDYATANGKQDIVDLLMQRG